MPSVLFVDDEVMVIKSLQRGLRGEPYEQFFASGGEEALRIMEENVIDVLVTDMRMPGMRGLDLLKTTKQLYPNIVKIVLSGYTQISQMIATINYGDIYRFIPKPWDLENDLKVAINDALDYAAFLANKETDSQRLAARNKLYQSMLNRFEEKKKRLINDLDTLKGLNGMVQPIVNELITSLELRDKANNDSSLQATNQDLITDLRFLLKVQNRLMKQLPFEAVKLDYHIVAEAIKISLDFEHPGMVTTVSAHEIINPRVYGTMTLLPDLITQVAGTLSKSHHLVSAHFEVSGNIDEMIDHEENEPLFMSVLMDMKLDGHGLDKNFASHFQYLSKTFADYATIRYAYKEQRFVMQMKMNVERGN